MNTLEQTLRKAGTLLAAAHAPWALLGGWAVSLRTEPRFTRDVDLPVGITADTEAESLVRRFCDQGFTILALKILARDDRRRPQDRVDIHALLRVMDAQGLADTQAALALITQRGFARGRDLARSLKQAQSEFRV